VALDNSQGTTAPLSPSRSFDGSEVSYPQPFIWSDTVTVVGGGWTRGGIPRTTMGTVDLDPSNPSIQGHEDRDPQRNGRGDPLRICRKGRVSSTSHGRRFASPRSVDTDTLGRHIPPRFTFFPSRFLPSPSVHAPPLPPRVAGSRVSPFERTLSLPSLPFKGSPSIPESFRLQPIFPPKPSFQTPSTCRPRSTWRVLRRNRSTDARRARKKHLKHVRVVVLPKDPDVVALRSKKKGNARNRRRRSNKGDRQRGRKRERFGGRGTTRHSRQNTERNTRNKGKGAAGDKKGKPEFGPPRTISTGRKESIRRTRRSRGGANARNKTAGAVRRTSLKDRCLLPPLESTQG